MSAAPDTWRYATLSEVVELQRGFDLPAQSRRPGPYPVLTSGETEGWHDEGPVAGPGFVVGRATNLGRPKWSDGAFWPHNTTMYAKNFKGNDPRWLFHLFEATDLTGFDSGSVQPMLNRNYIAQVRVVVAPLAEQQAIAEVLGALDDKIAANTALTRTADSYGSSLVRDALSGDRVPLAAIARITMGSSPRGETLNDAADGMPFFQGTRDFGFRTPTRRVYTTAPVRTAAAGDILVSVRAPVGEVNLAGEDLCIGRGIAAVRSNGGTQATLFYQLKTEREAWAPYEAEGTVFGSINRDQLHGILVHTVDESSRASLEHSLAAIGDSIASLERENRTLAATRDALLPQLMSGKLRVRDAEKIAAEAGA